MSSEHTTGPVPAENGSAEDEENETPAPQLNKPEPKHKKSQQDLHELVQKRFDQAELFLRDQLASHWKTGVYSASIARRPLPQCSNNDFYFVVRFSRPTEPHPIPSEAAQFRVHVWRGPDDTWDLEAQVELNEYKYTSEQLSGGAQALIDRALREKSRLGQTVDVHEEFEYSRGFM